MDVGGVAAPERIQPMSAVTDGRLHRLSLRLASEREVARRVRAWRRRRWVKTPLLWVVALLGAGLAWWARRGR